MKKFFKIIKLIFLAILIFLIGGVVLTKCTNCNNKKNETAVAYAEEIQSVTRSSSKIYLNFNNSITTYPYYSFVNESVGANGLVAIIYFTNFPLINFTLEVKSNIANKRYSLLFFSSDNIEISSGINYVSYNNSSNLFSYLGIYNEPNQAGLEDMTLYFYAGEYVPGYGQGLAAGLDQGYTEGYNTGVKDMQSGVFVGATVDIQIDSNEGFSNIVSGLTPNYVYQGINTLNLSQYYDIANIDYCTFTINFKDPWLYDQQYNTLHFQGDLLGLTEYATIVTPGNKNLTYKIAEGGAVLREDTQPLLISKIKVTVGRPADLGKFWLTAVDTGVASYNYGFNMGYGAGVEVGRRQGYGEGVNAGYSAGESEGYAKAVNEGASSLGLFTGAVSLIKVFFQLLTSLLETKIAGDINLGLLVLGLPAAFMIVNLAIGLVKKLLGARGASEGDEDG